MRQAMPDSISFLTVSCLDRYGPVFPTSLTNIHMYDQGHICQSAADFGIFIWNSQPHDVSVNSYVWGTQQEVLALQKQQHGVGKQNSVMLISRHVFMGKGFMYAFSEDSTWEYWTQV